MGFGNAILANDVPEHRETLGDAGLYYHGYKELASKLQAVLDDKALSDPFGGRPTSGHGSCTAGTPFPMRTRPG
jgi:hypothetical protein